MNNHNTLIFVSPKNIVKNIERKLSYPFCQLTINSIFFVAKCIWTKQIGGKDNFSIGVKLYIVDKESKDHTEYYIPYRIEGLRELEYIEYEEINE